MVLYKLNNFEVYSRKREDIQELVTSSYAEAFQKGMLKKPKLPRWVQREVIESDILPMNRGDLWYFKESSNLTELRITDDFFLHIDGIHLSLLKQFQEKLGGSLPASKNNLYEVVLSESTDNAIVPGDIMAALVKCDLTPYLIPSPVPERNFGKGLLSLLLG